MKRGVTLIELMVTVAVLGIAALLAGDAVIVLRRQANDVAQRERALQCLEFEAAALTSRTAGDPSVRAALLAELPDAMVDSQVRGPATIVTVSWQGTDKARHSRALAVLTGGWPMKRGFTLIELSICLSILAVVVPLTLALGRSFQQGQFEAAAQVEAAASMRSVSEELRRDLKTLAFLDDTALRLEGAGQCQHVEYRLTEEHLLVREGGEGCGPVRAIAANVRSIQRENGGVRVVFFKRVSAGRERTDSFFMGFGE